MYRKFEGIFLILIIIVIVIVYKILSAIFTIIADKITIITIVIFSGLVVFTAILLYLESYFKSKRFNHIKDSISKHTNNCNELNHYIQELKCSYLNIESYNYGTGTMTDNSVYNFHRREWNNVIQSNQIHNCSASVCKNASDQPMKYLCKYFGIKNDEESLSKFEKVLNDFSSVEQGKDLLKKEKETILRSISKSIPYLIKKYRNERLIRELGFETVDISETYIPTFTFQYVSAGGYSSSRCDIKLNIENLNLLINYLNDIIVWSKSIAGQRALMNSQLRDKIKERDKYKCCACGLGIEDEPNLLLEIDHKIPLSKGGMTTYDNLQTLCWRCNRAKGAKIL
jgi:hypothetical protein